MSISSYSFYTLLFIQDTVQECYRWMMGEDIQRTPSISSPWMLGLFKCFRKDRAYFFYISKKLLGKLVLLCMRK